MGSYFCTRQGVGRLMRGSFVSGPISAKQINSLNYISERMDGIIIRLVIYMKAKEKVKYITDSREQIQQETRIMESAK